MTYSDDYRQFVEDARDAVLALLDASEPDSWLDLRAGYGALRDALDQDDRQRERDERLSERGDTFSQPHRQPALRGRPAGGRWPEQRASLVLNALGDDQLLLREIIARVNTQLGSTGKRGDRAAYPMDVQVVVVRMLKAGQLEHAPERFGGRTLNRYSRKRTLEGPIAELEHAFNGEDAATA